jgi:5-(carboxyamino)imidazole ribonucleotide synthase
MLTHEPDDRLMRIGVIGAGQLGQMLGYAAAELGFECRFVDPSDSPPAASAGTVVKKPFDDAAALDELAAECDVLTYEFENVPVAALQAVAEHVPVYPPPAALAIAQDRLLEKQLFTELDIALPAYRRIDSRQDLADAASALGVPLVVKTRRFGYDGKGQIVLRSKNQVDAVWDELGSEPLIAEAFVPFDYEVSVIAARSRDGEIVIWPLAENEHVDGILRLSRAPHIDSGLSDRANAYVTRMLQHLDYVGVLALELFVEGDALLANEFAPRVHNSGHWTIEGAATSQFANHLLAVAGKPLGSTATPAYAAMINLIGTMPVSLEATSDDRVTLHDYGKSARPGRKLGHITLVAETAAERDRLSAEILKSVT